MRRPVGLLAVLLALAATASANADTPRWKAWLCRPDLKISWCNIDLSTTVIRKDGSWTRVVIPDTRPAIDCFYVYPTVSQDRGGNSDLRFDNSEKAAIFAQAARFSQVCRVFAPVYRQTTGQPFGDSNLAYADVLAAWRDYLAHDNHGRGVVLIGHSQGAFRLERLMADQRASVRKVLVSALLIGGSVPVNEHDAYDGFPACRTAAQTGCVIGYSSWGRTPPQDAGLESVGNPSEHVLCVNPGALGGGSGPITTIFAWAVPEGIVPGAINPAPSTFWVSFPALYRARCVRQGQRSWLLVTRIKHPGDPRPTVAAVLSPGMGLHAADVNLPLGNLLSIVQTEAKAYLASH